MGSSFEFRNQIAQSLSEYEGYRHRIVSIASYKKIRKSGVYNVFGALIVIVTGGDIVGDGYYLIVHLMSTGLFTYTGYAAAEKEKHRVFTSMQATFVHLSHKSLI